MRQSNLAEQAGTAGANQLVQRDSTGAISSSRINSRTTAFTSTSSISPDVYSYDQYSVTSLNTGLTINAPSGSPLDGTKLLFRIADNGAPQSITWNATYRVIGTTLPTTTTAGTTVYIGCIYNGNLSVWDVIAVAQQA